MIPKSSIQKISSTSEFLLIHDQKGAIQEFIAVPSMNWHAFYNQILSMKSLEPFYDLSGLDDSTSLKQIRLQGKNVKAYELDFGPIYSNLALHSLWTCPIGNGLFLARSTVSDVSPNNQLKYGHGFFFTDLSKETVEGYDKFFTPVDFGHENAPESMLGQPLSTYISPSPRAFQEAHLDSFKWEEIDQFAALFEADFSRSGASIPSSLRPEFASLDDNGLLVQAPAEKPAVLRFLPLADTGANDFILQVTVEWVRGMQPYFSAGRETIKDEDPDYWGYMAGPDPANRNAICKRFGYIAASNAIQPVSMKTGAYTFAKIGKSLFLYHDQVCLLKHFDEGFVSYSKGQFAFIVRMQSACLIKSATLKIRMSSASGKRQPSYHIAEFVKKPGRFCLLTRFYNNSLTFHHLAGYQPIDISVMQNTIRELDKKTGDLERRTTLLNTLLKRYQSNQGDFIGSAEGVRSIKETAKTIAASGATVLIEGPTGAGKEVLAHFIHRNSPRQNAPFIKVDCATVPKELIESHLFGHEKGAFTGAVTQQTGMLERAGQGTLFLDEVGNLPLDIQSKLLQFFNDFTLTRIGGKKSFKVDVRCILASNLNLLELVRAGKFRSDLYYRINVIVLRLPPLKERSRDIPELAGHFLMQYGAANNKPAMQITPEALDKLQSHLWPGNIRELKNVMERAVVFAKDASLTPDLIEFEEPAKPGRKKRAGKPCAPYALALSDPERISERLRNNKGNVKATAEELGVGRVSLHLYLKAHKISSKDFRKGLV